MNKPLVDQKYLLEKFPGKGGWTYAAIPEIPPNKNNPFGWVQVHVRIDHFELKRYKLMPMGNGSLFLPVRKDIRQKIGKKAGDWVHIVLSMDDTPPEIPEEFLVCLKEDDAAHHAFLNLTEGQQKEFIDWINAAKTDKTKVERIATTLNKLIKGERLKSERYTKG
ncbi:MAG: DUF1905 domain-containing protein [Chitinophagaceae bacterium]|nr:DUF1905 domain-containing protein [Chitinophagaceae bacterium]